MQLRWNTEEWKVLSIVATPWGQDMKEMYAAEERSQLYTLYPFIIQSRYDLI